MIALSQDTILGPNNLFALTLSLNCESKCPRPPTVQAGTDTVSDDDRAVIDSEIQQLKKEITRIANDTEFNGQPLLNGNFDLKGYTDNENVKVSYYSEEVNVAKYDLDFAGLITNNGDGSYSVDNSILKTAFPGVEGLKSEYNGSILKITGDGNFDLRLDIKDGENFSEKVNIDITGIGAMKIQAGANEGQEISIRIQEISLKKFGLDDLKFTPDLDDDGNPIEGSSAANAQKGIAAIKDAMSYLSEARAKLGAYQNRMEHNTTNLDVSSENMTASYSRIMDVDMAEEMTIYSTQQILSQAGISMLSQANQLPEKVLQLLQ